MCDFRISTTEMVSQFGADPDGLAALYRASAQAFPDMVQIDATGFRILDQGRPLTRMIARSFDAYEMSEHSHSVAV